MQLAVAVADPVTQSLSDVLVDGLADVLARLARSGAGGAVTSLASRRAGHDPLAGPSRLYADDHDLDGRQCVRDSPIREGSLVGTSRERASWRPGATGAPTR